jgi:hypothetical protein
MNANRGCRARFPCFLLLFFCSAVAVDVGGLSLSPLLLVVFSSAGAGAGDASLLRAHKV